MANRTLPDEVIVDGILVRLPTKTIGRFRCVSKLWRTSLSSPRFTRAHLKFHTRDGPQGIILALFFRNFSFCTINLANESRIVSRLFNHPSFAGPTALIGSCHGLLLVRNESDGNCGLDLFNPITLENLKIPESGDSRYCNQGLGCDSLQDDYKIISISIKEPFSMRVYSVKMGTWKSLGNSPYEHFRTGGLFFNGSLHWLAPNGVEWIIAAFSLAKEEFSELALPEDFFQSDLEGFLRFTVIGGCLSLMQYLSFGGVINFWMMQEYGAQDSWKKYTITIGKHKYRYLGVLEENEIVFAKCERKLVLYDWRKGSWRDVGEPDIASLDVNETASFGESLISPYHGRRVA